MTATAASSRTVPLRVGVLAVGGAALMVAALWAAAQILGIELRVDPGDGRAPGVVSLPFAVTVSLAVSLVGWGARVLLDRLIRRSSVVWTVLAILVLLASFPPLVTVEATAAATAVLALMHVAVAAVLIPVFGRRAP
ncbi:hypothetical protein AWW66_19085 [Micromonospora rosaria]|uniref:Uncharacterized protein n=1 Tax=Micromonospora rosaria TaxID=47874 RepID=A0A136PPR1_9ACTN|nr:DUF6069 family protein [Micromonospora rosaria]KXK60391.1 hypothetical protein AWW66_19085 [Micromonospora rosaria]